MKSKKPKTPYQLGKRDARDGSPAVYTEVSLLPYKTRAEYRELRTRYDAGYAAGIKARSAKT